MRITKGEIVGMRRLWLGAGILLVVVASGAALAEVAALSGSIETSIAMNPSAPTLTGFIREPAFAEWNDSKSTPELSHLYVWPEVHAVDWLRAEVDNEAAVTWELWISADGMDWTCVGPFDSAVTHSVQVTINSDVRCVMIIAGGGQIEKSTITARLSSTDSGTFSKWILEYALHDWTFKGTTTLDLTGMSALRLEAAGDLGTLALTSRMDFYPGKSVEKEHGKSAPSTIHLYDLGQVRSVLWLNVENVSATADWEVWRSTDATNWTKVVGLLTSTETSSGPISINESVRYIEVRASAGLINASKLTILRPGISWANPTKSWRTSCALSIGEISVSGAFTLTDGSSSLKVSFRGPTSDVLSIYADATFALDADCSFAFSRASATLKFPFACIDEISANVRIAYDGFNSLSLKVSPIETGWPWLDLSGAITFTPASKTMTLTPKLVLANDSCIEVLAEFSAGDSPAEIDGISIYGLRFKQTWNGISFTSLSYLDGSRYVKGNYWQKIVIENDGDMCCGGSIDFEVATYFQYPGDKLFGWGETEIELSMDLSETFTVTLGTVVDTWGWMKLVTGFETTW